MVVSAITVSDTLGITRTCTESLFKQPLSFKFTTYQVLLVGFTVGVAVLGLLIFVNGVQLKAPVPAASRVTASDKQIKVSVKPSVIKGLSSTLMLTVAVLLQPLLLVTINSTVFVPDAG